MRLRVIIRCFGLFLAIGIFSGMGVAPAVAQIRIVSPKQEIEAQRVVKQVLQDGAALEKKRLWGDALTHYEDALHEHPNHDQLQSRYHSARAHYDFSRRYRDASFQRALDKLGNQGAAELYASVLLKIESHYVTRIDWRGLVDRGTKNFAIALDQDLFKKRHLREVSAKDVESFRRESERLIAGRTIQSRHDAREAVSQMARMASQRLGLSYAATMLEYTSGAVAALDPYSTFLTGDQLDDLFSQIEGNFVGLGIEIKSGNKGLAIVEVIPGSPAQESGLRSGDVIVSVDGKSTTEMSTDDAADLLQGREGSPVELSVVTGKQPPHRMRIRRAHVEVPSVVDVKMVDRQGGVGYLRLTSFQKTSMRDLNKAMWKLHRDGMRSLIIDVRGNPGGLLNSAVEMSDKFLTSGVIVSTRGRSSQEDFNYRARADGTWKVPLVVLVDHESASASEIFAGAIQDHRRGKVVGRRSYGKGSVQGIFPLSLTSGGIRCGIRLTTAKFYSPSGRPISGAGVRPDIIVRSAGKPSGNSVAANPTESGAKKQDLVLSAGIQTALEYVANR